MSSAKRAKRVEREKRAKRVERNAKPKKRSEPPTVNGKLIQDLMDQKGIRGSFKDYTVIVGCRLVEWSDSWDIFDPAGKPMGFEGVMLVHKRALAQFVGEKFAAKFWNGVSRTPAKGT